MIPFLSALARDDSLDHALGFVRVPYLDAEGARLTRRSIVSAGEQGIPHIQHIFGGDAEDVAKLSNTVRLVDSGERDVDRGRAAQSNGEIRKIPVESRLDLLAFRKVGIPRFLGVERSLLAQGGVGYLTLAILNRWAP